MRGSTEIQSHEDLTDAGLSLDITQIWERQSQDIHSFGAAAAAIGPSGLNPYKVVEAHKGRTFIGLVTQGGQTILTTCVWMQEAIKTIYTGIHATMAVTSNFGLSSGEVMGQGQPGTFTLEEIRAGGDGIHALTTGVGGCTFTAVTTETTKDSGIGPQPQQQAHPLLLLLLLRWCQ